MNISTPTRTQRKAEATRLAIIHTAEALILEEGLSALTLEAVAERADIAVQTIYNRVGGRSALLLAVTEKAMEENRVYMERAYAAAGTPLERIRVAAMGYIRFAKERPNEFRLMASPPDTPEAQTRISSMVKKHNARLEAALRDGIADGSIDPAIDPYLVATAMWAAMNGMLSLAWRADSAAVTSDVMDQLLAQSMELTFKGLTAHLR